MKVSVCITTFNEKRETVEKLLDALNNQTLKPDEIILIDAKDYGNCSRAEGRNEAIKIARNEIIAITDVGCVPRNDWLEKLVGPLAHLGGVKAHPRGVLYPEVAIVNHSRGGISVVAGYYEMTYKNNLQKAMRVFMGVLPEKFGNNFLPSARSMAFTKTIWKKAGGFPENLKNTAEDTLFNVNLIKAGARIIRVKNAIVEWGMPESIINFHVTIFKYAMGDGQAGIWWHPVKGIQSHNVKIMSIYGRYLISITLFILNKSVFLLYALCYMLYAYKKAGLWGILLQFVSDFAVMAGFARGILKTCVKV